MSGDYDRALAKAQTDAMNLAHRLFDAATPAVHWRDLKTVADTYYAPVCHQHTETERRVAKLEAENARLREALQAMLDFPGGMYAPALEAKSRAALKICAPAEEASHG